MRKLRADVAGEAADVAVPTEGVAAPVVLAAEFRFFLHASAPVPEDVADPAEAAAAPVGAVQVEDEVGRDPAAFRYS